MSLQQSSGDWQWSDVAQPKFHDAAQHDAAVARLWAEYLLLRSNAPIKGKPGVGTSTPNQPMPRYCSDALAASYNTSSDRASDV
jgi:hypothetical protein